MDRVINFINLAKKLNDRALAELCEKVNDASKCANHNVSCVDCPIYNRENLTGLIRELSGLVLAK